VGHFQLPAFPRTAKYLEKYRVIDTGQRVIEEMVAVFFSFLLF
jgi:phosphatidylglycerophosphatase A